MLVATRDPCFIPGRRPVSIHHDDVRTLRPRCPERRRAAARPHHERVADGRHAAGDPGRHRPAPIRSTAPISPSKRPARACAPTSSRCSTRASTPAPGICWCATTSRHSSRPAARSIRTPRRRSRRCSRPTSAAPPAAPRRAPCRGSAEGAGAQGRTASASAAKAPAAPAGCRQHGRKPRCRPCPTRNGSLRCAGPC